MHNRLDWYVQRCAALAALAALVLFLGTLITSVSQ
jgi:hypothetical protein